MPFFFSTGRALRTNARLRLALQYTLSTCAPQVRQCVNYQDEPDNLDLGALRDAYAVEEERRMWALCWPGQEKAVVVQAVGVEGGDVALPREHLGT